MKSPRNASYTLPSHMGKGQEEINSFQGKIYSIQEASRLSQIPAYILRYWEAHRLLSPDYTSRGHRRYKQQDIELILKVKDWIYIKGMRVDGARKALLEETRRRKKSAELPLELATQSAASAILEETKSALRDLLQILR